MATIKFSDFTNITTGPINNSYYIVGYDSGANVNTRFTFGLLEASINLANTYSTLPVSKITNGTNGYFLQAGASTPSWFNLFGTANTFTTTQTVLWNNGVSRSLILNAMTGSSTATSFSGAAGTAVSFSSGNYGIMMTGNSGINSPWYYPIFTLANRAVNGYTATVPQIQLRLNTTIGGGSTNERNVEWAMPTNSAFTTYDVAIRYDLFHTSSTYRFVQHYMRTSIDTTGVLNPASAYLHMGAATTSIAQINLKTSAGTNPSAPADGDIWYDGTNLKMRVGATTKTFTLV